jgi:hypothetical protein
MATHAHVKPGQKRTDNSVRDAAYVVAGISGTGPNRSKRFAALSQSERDEAYRKARQQPAAAPKPTRIKYTKVAVAERDKQRPTYSLLTGKRERQTVTKTRLEFDAQIAAQDGACIGCCMPFGHGAWEIAPGEFRSMRPQHGHVTKLRVDGGDKDHDYAQCEMCNTMQGTATYDVVMLQVVIAQTVSARGYRWFVRLMGIE